MPREWILVAKATKCSTIQTKQKGYFLILPVLFVLLMCLLMMGQIYSDITVQQAEMTSVNVKALQVTYAAESGLELAFNDLQNQMLTYPESTALDVSKWTSGVSINFENIDVQVKGKSKGSDSLFLESTARSGDVTKKIAVTIVVKRDEESPWRALETSMWRELIK